MYSSDGGEGGNRFGKFTALGYGGRLIPIVPPDAEISPTSRLARAGSDPRGKAPGIRKDDGTWEGVDFTTIVSDETRYAMWDAMGAGVGMRVGDGLIAVDVDVEDPETSRAIYQAAQALLGPTPVRVGRMPRCMLFYRVAEDQPNRKLKFHPRERSGDQVDILARSKQAVVEGIHPKTQAPYSWPRALVPFDQLTVVTASDIDAFLDHVRVRHAPHGRVSGQGGNSDPELHPLPPEHLIGTAERMRDAIKHLPNSADVYPGRDDFIHMGQAIKGALPHEPELAYELFSAWAGRFDGRGEAFNESASPTAAEIENTWRGLHPSRSLGADYVYTHAERFGGWTGRNLGLVERFFPDPEADEAVETTTLEDGSEVPVPTAVPQRGERRLEMLTPEQILGLPAPKFLIDRHIPEGQLGFLYSNPGAGKSFIALDWSLHIAYGLKDWHGDAINARPGATVLYLAKEGASGFRQRLRAWLNQRPELDPAAGRFRLVRESLSFMSPDDIGRLVDAAGEEVVAAGGVVDLIVVDTVSRALPGAEENLQRDMTLYVRACEALQEAFQAAVLGVHHASKGGAMRGSTVLQGAGDFVFKLSRDTEVEDPSVRRLYCEKQKDAPDGWDEHYALDVVPANPPGELDGGTSLVPRRVDLAAVEETTAAEVEAQEQAGLAALRAAWEAGDPWRCSKQADGNGVKELSKTVKVSARQAAGLLRQWEEDGLIIKFRAGKPIRAEVFRPADGLHTDGVFT